MKTEQRKPARSAKGKQTGGFARAYWRRAYSLLDPYMGRIYRRFGGIEDQVRRAGIRLTYKVYLCGAVLASLIAGACALAVSGLIAALVSVPIATKVGLPIGLGVVAFFAAFGVTLLMPRYRVGNRKRKIDEDLAFTVGRMGVLSASGMTPENIMKEIAADDSNDPLTGEFRKMVRDMNLLGMDLGQALVEERKRSPSPAFNSFLDGMMSTASSGADIQQYLVKQGKSLMSDKRLRSKAISESLGVVAEMYTTILVVMPLILIILFAVMGVIAGSLGGISILVLIELVVYAMVPLGGIMIMVIADGIVPKR